MDLRSGRAALGVGVSSPTTLAVAAVGLSRSQWGSWTTQMGAASVVVGEELVRETARVVTAVPARGVSAVARRMDRWFSAAVPVVLDAVLSRVDLTEVVVTHLDVDRVVAAVDL